MSARSSKFLESRSEPAPERAAAPPKRRSLDWVRGVLGRQARVDPGRKAVVEAKRPGDPKRPAEADKPLSLVTQQCADLGARLLIHDPATQPVRHLFMLHDELQRGGWERVETLPLKVIDRALTEAEILDCAEPSPMLTTILEELRGQKTAAEARAAREAAEAEWEVPQVPEVSDTNFDEYELMERSWAGTIPAGLELPARDTTM